jgi:hypothetical protein
MDIVPKGGLMPRSYCTAIAVSVFLSLSPAAAGTSAAAPTSDVSNGSLALSAQDSLSLEAIATVLEFFKAEGDEVWEGYDLSRRPFLAYLPGRWAVLANAPDSVAGFTAYPEDWPAMGAPALVRTGPFGVLVGQLAFDLDLGGVTTVAVPLSLTTTGDRRGSIGNGFRFIVHEAFHQYQHDAFASIPNDMSDEEYPMLDGENTALASLEAQILIDAIKAMGRGDLDETRELAEEFVAVRRARWSRRPELLPAYERPQELIEGTAKYVEVRSIGMMGDLCREMSAEEAVAGRTAVAPPSACDVFGPVTLQSYLLSDFADRVEDGVINPSDMPRNRMYPVAAATALLLDYFGIDWKTRASDPVTSPGLAEMLGEGLGLDAALTDSLVARASARYDFDAIRAACIAQSEAYPRAYYAAVDSLMGLPGYHVTVEAPVSGLSRSRSCSGMRWTLDNPQRSFSKSCQAYALKRLAADDLFVEIHDSAIAEEMSEDEGSRRVTFLAPDVLSVRVDGVEADLGHESTQRFTTLALSGSNFSISYEGEGSLSVDGTDITARLMPGQ